MALPEADDEFVALGGPWVPDREQAVLTSVQKGGGFRTRDQWALARE
jgi:hypothetical protein